MTRVSREELPRFAELETEYEILREIGRGGTAVVYLARERELGRLVAVKVIRSTYVEDTEAATRLEREAQMIGGLQHPNIVVLYATRRLGDGSLALIMQYAPGRTLKEEIRAQGPLPFGRVQRILEDLGAALAYAHRRHIVHRDIKPDNIYVDGETGLARLSDFGIACISDGRTKLTLPGAAIGTPTYMSPEQIDGGTLDGRSDLYSLGLVGWEMLTGRQPWAGETLFGIIYKQKHEQLPPVAALRAGVPATLAGVIDRSLSKNPAQRWSGADAFVRALGDGAGAAAAANPPATNDVPERPAGPDATKAAAIASYPLAGAPAADTPTILFRPGEALPPRATATPVADDAPVIAAPVADDTPVIAAPVAEDVPAIAAPVAADSAVIAEPVAADVPVIAAAAFADDVAVQPDQADQAGPRGRRRLVLAALAFLLLAGATITLALTRGSFGEDAESQLTPVPPALQIADPREFTGVPETFDGMAAGEAQEPPDLEQPPVSPASEHEPGQIAAGADTAAVAAAPEEEASAAAGEAPPAASEEEPSVADARPDAAAPVVAARPATTLRVRSGLFVGGMHSCMLAGDGAAWCWGGNDQGQIGDGSTARRAVPVELEAAEPFARLSAGVSHTCALTATGAPYCWGANDHGQLGTGDQRARQRPVALPSPTGLVEIRAGGSHTCGLDGRGRLFCWGGNGSGQIGDGSRTVRPRAVAVSDERRFRDVAPGWTHTCALATDRTAWCWGSNASGELGTGDTRNRLVPAAVAGGHAFVDLAVGTSHSCGLRTDGTVLCWGANTYGQLGDARQLDSAEPVAALSDVPFAELTVGSVHACARTADGRAFCWGRNVYGQLGDGTTEDRSRPTQVVGGERFSALRANGAHSCGTTDGGARLCWGYNIEGQLGDGSRTNQSRPVAVLRPW